MSLLIFYDGGHLARVLPLIILDILFCFMKAFTTSLIGWMVILIALGWIFFNPGQIYLKRKMVQQKRKVSDDEITRFMSGKIINERSKVAVLLNGLSLAYCRLSGLMVMENKPE